MSEYCPICLSKGKNTQLEYLQVNYTEASKMCPDVKCPYPMRLGYTDVFIKRNVMDLLKEKPPPNKNAAVPLELKKHQNMKTNKEQSAINTQSSSVKTTNSFEGFTNWFSTNDSVSDQETSNNGKLDVSNFSNELMELDFQDKANIDIDFDIDKLVEEEFMEIATNDNPLETGLSGLNPPANKMESDSNSLSLVAHRNDTNEVTKDNNKINNSLSNVGESKLNIPKTQSINLKNVCESGTGDENIKSCISRGEIDKTNRSVVEIVKSQQLTNSPIIKLGSLGKKSQLIVVKCGENIQPPTLTDMSENVVSVTYIDKQNDQKTVYPNSSYKTLTSQQPDLKQILKPPCKNAKNVSKPASSIRKNKFEGLSIKQEIKGKNALPCGWNAITNNPQNITTKIEETKKQIGKGNDIQIIEKGPQVKRGQFEGFSFNEALKSINTPNLRVKREIKLMIQQSKLTSNKKTSESKSIKLEGVKMKGKSDKIKNEDISEINVNKKNDSCNSVNSDDDWIKALVM